MTNQEILEFCGKLFLINCMITFILMFLTMCTENIPTCKMFGISMRIREIIESTYLRSILTIPFTFTLMGIAEYVIPMIK